MWLHNPNVNYDIVGHCCNIIGASCIIMGFYAIGLFFVWLGMYNTEEDKHYEEQIVELTEERKFFTEDFDEQKIFAIYNAKGWWDLPKVTEDLEEFVGSESQELEMRISEYWEIPASNAISNNVWLVPDNESFFYIVKSHEFLIERIKLDFYVQEYILYISKLKTKRNGFIYKNHFIAYNLSFNRSVYQSMFSFYYLSPQEQSYHMELNDKAVRIKNTRKKSLVEYKIENLFYDVGGLSLLRRRNLSYINSPSIKETIEI